MQQRPELSWWHSYRYTSHRGPWPREYLMICVRSAMDDLSCWWDVREPDQPSWLICFLPTGSHPDYWTQNLHFKKAPQVMHMCIKVWVRVVVSVMVLFCLHIRNVRRIFKNVLTPMVAVSRVSHSTSLEESQAWIYIGYAGSSQWFCMATAIC